MLKMLTNSYHTGIRRDVTNKDIWRRSSDGIQVNVQDWTYWPPFMNDDRDFLHWYFLNNSNENTVFNWSDMSLFVVCEY